MEIEHIAMYVKDLERTREFFEKYFGAVSKKNITILKRIFNRIFYRLMMEQG